MCVTLRALAFMHMCVRLGGSWKIGCSLTAALCSHMPLSICEPVCVSGPYVIQMSCLTIILMWESHYFPQSFCEVENVVVERPFITYHLDEDNSRSASLFHMSHWDPTGDKILWIFFFSNWELSVASSEDIDFFVKAHFSNFRGILVIFGERFFMK